MQLAAEERRRLLFGSQMFKHSVDFKEPHMERGFKRPVDFKEPHLERGFKRHKMFDTFLDTMSKRQASQALFFLQRFIVGCGLPFAITSSPFFRDFIYCLRPAFAKYMPKTDRPFRTRWLDILHEHTQIRVHRLLGLTPNSYSTLATDG
ncbi:hypothetical protein AAMO2058_001438200 [Amorphochlora amoebiformis]